MMVDLGPDRLHHGALRHISNEHPAFQDATLGKRSNKLLDDEIGETVSLTGPDTVVMVVSNHGIKLLLGSICINEILIRNGCPVLDEAYPKMPVLLNSRPFELSGGGRRGPSCAADSRK
ncbi:MAG: hypothetical protein JXR76_01840 [Deltaproteobacteria bacterium]|nr:hypothetical protein [Deltaproteobacteria bacterium]